MIKLDTSTILQSKTEQCYTMCSHLIKLFKNAEIRVNAKNIETEEQYKIMREMGCDYFQGYYISFPQNSISKLSDEIKKIL